ncbi:adenosine deaminase [Hyphococcus sp.]|uniref:adenosine deaminase n=1 Tax=Hyphococcus sp. TaxID=2038636 RepID=UPI003CCC2E3B
MSNAAPIPPVAELHCHVEATVSPADARRLAARHRLDISSVFDDAGAYRWRTFTEFLHVYDAVSEVVRTPEDYFEITAHYFERMAAKGMIYGELIVSPAHAARFGLPYAVLMDAVASAMREAETENSVAGRIIVTAVRHYGAEHAFETAKAAAASPHPYVTGFGMAGDEAFGAAADFRSAFEIARDAGLNCTVHAGEILGPESVRDALQIFKVQRIGHGVRAIEDPALVAELADRSVTLEVCPTSNVAMGLYPSIAEHPVRVLSEAGVNVTLNADDPAFFDTDPVEEYKRAANAHGFSYDTLLGFTRNAIEAAFCDDETKTRLLNNIATADDE